MTAPRGGALRRLPSDPVVLGAALLVGLVALCSAMVHEAEGWSWLDSVYFSVATLTTVGDPNLAPAKDITKGFLILYLPLGIGIGFSVLTLLGGRILEVQRRRSEKRRRGFEALRAHDAESEGHPQP